MWRSTPKLPSRVRLCALGRIMPEPSLVCSKCVVRREKLADWAPAYAGYQTIGAVGSGVDYEPALRSAADQITLGPDQYYALGDNTGNSRDSRYWGPVPERNLLGPAAIVYWPFTSPRRGVIH